MIERPTYSRRVFLRGAAAGALFAPLPVALALQTGEVFTPEQFGAAGDGRTNDSRAFASLSAAVQRNDGGTIRLRAGATYLVGSQVAGGRYDRVQLAFAPSDIITLTRCRKPIVIEGNGATLKASAGLRYGGFNSRGGRVQPYSTSATQAWPYVGLIYLHDNLGGFTIRDLNLDGSNESAQIGGTNGVDGIQLPGAGLYLVDNAGLGVVENVRSHHHCLDGMLVRTPARDSGQLSLQVRNLTCEYNGRQGVSDLGGHRHRYENLRTNHTGRAGVSSSPAAGLDIEPDAGGVARLVEVVGHESINNNGPAFGADSGDSAAITISNFLWNATTGPVACCFLNKPGIELNDGLILGPIGNVYDAPSWEEALRMRRVIISNDPSLSPLRRATGAGGYLLAPATDRRFSLEDCEIRAVGGAHAMLSPGPTPRFHNLRLRGGVHSTLGGTFTGRCDLTGPSLNVDAMVNRAEILRVNGVLRAR